MLEVLLWIVSGLFHALFGAFLIGGFGCLYILPYLLARWSGHPDARGLLWVNLLAGWTIVAWLVCLTWVFLGAVRKGAGPGKRGE